MLCGASPWAYAEAEAVGETGNEGECATAHLVPLDVMDVYALSLVKGVEGGAVADWVVDAGATASSVCRRTRTVLRTVRHPAAAIGEPEPAERLAKAAHGVPRRRTRRGVTRAGEPLPPPARWPFHPRERPLGRLGLLQCCQCRVAPAPAASLAPTTTLAPSATPSPPTTLPSAATLIPTPTLASALLAHRAPPRLSARVATQRRELSLHHRKRIECARPGQLGGGSGPMKWLQE